MGQAAQVTLRCAGCGAEPPPDQPLVLRCTAATGADDVDHVLRRQLDLATINWLHADQSQPYLRYRECLLVYQRARQWGISDAQYADIVCALDRRVGQIDGRGLTTTPLQTQPDLAAALNPPGDTARCCTLWVKDETRNVAGSHKARHLFNVALYLRVLQQARQLPDAAIPRLAIASCGNAALAAAVLACAMDRPLDVYVPPDADRQVLTRLRDLGATVVPCPRTPGVPGDPCVARFAQAVAGGALPFSCQGHLNGLAVEGGQTLGYELVEQLMDQSTTLDRLFVQVGGGALASACIQALREAHQLGLIARLPRIHAVQTQGSAPLPRAFELVCELPELDPGDPASVARAIRYAATHRSRFMWPWECTPRSMAQGILDDETYDWLAVVEGMLLSGGHPLVVGEHALQRANAAAGQHAGIAACHTGTAGLAGLSEAVREGTVGNGEQVAVIFTGKARG